MRGLEKEKRRREREGGLRGFFGNYGAAGDDAHYIQGAGEKGDPTEAQGSPREAPGRPHGYPREAPGDPMRPQELPRDPSIL